MLLLRLWNLTDLGAISCHVLEGHKDSVNTVALSPDARWALTASSDATAKVWDLQSLEHILSYPLEGHSKLIYSVFLSPDGSRAVTNVINLSKKLYKKYRALGKSSRAF